MTRGPPPLKAIDLALKIAKQQGDVRDADGIFGFRCDLMIFFAFLTVYVRVKRVYAVVRDPRDITFMFGDAVRQIRTVPQTAATQRQIWAVTPWDTIQYFLVLDDRIIEIQADGTPMPAAGSAPGPAAAPEITAIQGMLQSPAAVPGFTCPFFGRVQK